MAGSSTAAPSRGTARRGSKLTDKQIAHAVKDGRAVEVLLPDESRLYGWIMGSDDYHWGLVSRLGAVSLVHKSAPCLTFTEHLLERQAAEVRALVEPVVEPFRNYVMREHFSKTAPAS